MADYKSVRGSDDFGREIHRIAFGIFKPAHNQNVFRLFIAVKRLDTVGNSHKYAVGFFIGHLQLVIGHVCRADVDIYDDRAQSKHRPGLDLFGGNVFCGKFLIEHNGVYIHYEKAHFHE